MGDFVAAGMKSKQMYFTEQLCDLMEKTFGEGKVSANVERIIRAHLANPEAEKKLRLMEINKEIARFNSEYNMQGHLVFE